MRPTCNRLKKNLATKVSEVEPGLAAVNLQLVSPIIKVRSELEMCLIALITLVSLVGMEQITFLNCQNISEFNSNGS